jgi:hypothetical protein
MPEDRVQFNDEGLRRNSDIFDKPSSLDSYVMKIGLAKERTGAQKVLLVSAVVFALLAIGVFIFAANDPKPDVPQEVIDEAMNRYLQTSDASQDQ